MGHDRRQDDREEDEQQWPDDAAEEHSADGGNGREDELREWVEPLVPGLPGRALESEAYGVLRADRHGQIQAVAPDAGSIVADAGSIAGGGSTRRSPCGKRAFVRRAIALRMRYTTKNVVTLSIGSEMRPWPS